jgi:hypothetical protein
MSFFLVTICLGPKWLCVHNKSSIKHKNQDQKQTEPPLQKAQEKGKLEEGCPKPGDLKK